MSRLESFIRRMQAQCACIDFASEPGNVPEGPVFELGLGNGRTYDHLRERFRGREIFVFDRRIAAQPGSAPDWGHLYLGEIEKTLPRAAARFRGRVAFIHCDISSGDGALDRVTTEMLAPLLARAAAPDALVASDQPIALPGWQTLPQLAGVAEGRYFLYRKPKSAEAHAAPERRRAAAAGNDVSAHAAAGHAAAFGGAGAAGD
jgi:hypothetical protein